MTTLEVTLTLPDQLAIEEALQREAGKQLLDAMQRLRDANAPPMTEADIATAVSAMRAARKARGEAGH
jgi:Xaa-Pro aminopeptidase